MAETDDDPVWNVDPYRETWRLKDGEREITTYALIRSWEDTENGGGVEHAIFAVRTDMDLQGYVMPQYWLRNEKHGWRRFSREE